MFMDGTFASIHIQWYKRHQEWVPMFRPEALTVVFWQYPCTRLQFLGNFRPRHNIVCLWSLKCTGTQSNLLISTDISNCFQREKSCTPWPVFSQWQRKVLLKDRKRNKHTHTHTHGIQPTDWKLDPTYKKNYETQRRVSRCNLRLILQSTLPSQPPDRHPVVTLCHFRQLNSAVRSLSTHCPRNENNLISV